MKVSLELAAAAPARSAASSTSIVDVNGLDATTKGFLNRTPANSITGLLLKVLYPSGGLPFYNRMLEPVHGLDSLAIHQAQELAHPHRAHLMQGDLDGRQGRV